ncbi:MAG: SpoIIE family protein phosphatase [Silvanigrellales bacterium]|nr:SpoIIE family protein phosphatase [Silvanigrellales bacterium]
MARSDGNGKRQTSARKRAKATWLGAFSIRHVAVALTLALSALGAWVGHRVGAHVSQSVATALSRPDARKAIVQTKRLPAVEASLRDLRTTVGSAVAFSVLFVSLVFLYSFKRLFVRRVDTVVEHLRRAARNPDDVGKLAALNLASLDTREVAALLRAVNEGLAELDLRNRCRALVKATAERLRHAEESHFLLLACATLREESQGIGEAGAYIARATDDANGFLIEEGVPPSRQGEQTQAFPARRREASPREAPRAQDLVSRSNLAEMHAEAVIQFLRSGHALSWQGSLLFLRTHLTSDGAVSLVTLVSPADRGALTALQFEHLCSLWASEVARAWHQLRFQDLATSLEISQQLQRKWVQSDSGATAAESRTRVGPIDDCVGFESMPSRFINGDFLCVFRLEKRNASIVILGDVTGAELRAGLAATGCVAAVADRFDARKGDAPHLLLDALMHSLNRYMWAAYRGALGLRTLGIYFNHETGQGALGCFGQPFPYVLSPVDRKPMVLVPAVNPGMMGLSEEVDTTPTSFQLLAGQVLFACTEGILATEDVQGKRFEKMIQRGTLADICQQNADATAPLLLSKLLDAARAHAGNTSIRNDLTAVALKVMRER